MKADMKPAVLTLTLAIIIVLTMLAIKAQLQKPGNDAAKEAIRALEALQSVVRSGVSYRDYGPRKADARIIVDRFLREYPKHPVAIHINEAMKHYEAAKEIWYKYNFIHEGAKNLPISFLSVFVDQYPEIESEASFTNDFGEKRIILSPTLNIIWNKASESIERARSVLR